MAISLVYFSQLRLGSSSTIISFPSHTVQVSWHSSFFSRCPIWGLSYFFFKISKQGQLKRLPAVTMKFIISDKTLIKQNVTCHPSFIPAQRWDFWKKAPASCQPSFYIFKETWVAIWSPEAFWEIKRMLKLGVLFCNLLTSLHPPSPNTLQNKNKTMFLM